MPNLWMQLFAQPWAIEPASLQAFLERCQGIKVGETLAEIQVAYQLPIAIGGGVARIPISGVLLKSVPGWVRYYGIEATGYDEIRQMVAMAVSNPKVDRIELRIDSPGGQVAGGMEAADAIREASAAKPVTAVVEDLAASGAYWLATSAETITAGPNAEIGSIGVYMVYRDWSKLFEDAGVKTIVIRSGEHKGMGVPGAPITESQIAAEQEIVDHIAEHFIAQVATGRKMSIEQVRPLATGRVWLAPKAAQLNLIDAVTKGGQSAEANRKSEGDTTMPENHAEQSPDALAQERQRISQIHEGFADDPKFAMEAVSNGWTLDQAKGIAFDRLKAAAKATPKGAANPPTDEEAPTGSPSPNFMAQARQRAAERKISLTQAMREVAASEPDLHESFVARESKRTLLVKGGGKAAGRVG